LKWYGHNWKEEIEHEDSIEVVLHPCECPDCLDGATF